MVQQTEFVLIREADPWNALDMLVQRYLVVVTIPLLYVFLRVPTSTQLSSNEISQNFLVEGGRQTLHLCHSTMIQLSCPLFNQSMSDRVIVVVNGDYS